MTLPVVEFFGLPGSGKSTINDLLVECCKNNNISVATREDVKNWSRSRSVFHKTVTILLLAVEYAKHMINLMLKLDYKTLFDFDLMKRFAYSIKTSLDLKQYSQKHTYDIIILHQWTVQTIWSAYANKRGPDVSKLKKIVQSLDHICPRKYVCFYVELGETSKRIANRQNGASPYDGYDERTIANLLPRNNELLNNIIDALGFKGKDLWIVDAMKTPTEQLNILLQKISNESLAFIK